MKTLIVSLSLSVIISAVAMAMVLSGCKTPVNTERLSLVARDATRLGTYEALRDHPEWQPQFEQARDQLEALAKRDSLTVGDLVDVISVLPVSELSSDEARWALAGTRLTITLAGWSDVEIVRVEQLRPVATAIASGITLGIADLKLPPAPASSGKKHYVAK